MADSKRQKIVEAVVTRMKLINGAGSYVTNVNNRVEDSRTLWDENELPAISVFDGEMTANPATSKDYRAGIHEMAVLVRGYTVQDDDGAAAARDLSKDIMTAIRQDDSWTVSSVPLVMQSREVRNSIVRNNDSFEVEGCEVEFMVQVFLQKFNAE